MNKLFISLLGCLLLVAQVASAQTNMQKRINSAINILETKQSSSSPIPQKVIDKARGVAIISVDRGGLIFGGMDGEGVVVARTQSSLGPSWSVPIAFNMSGGSFGAQIGFQTLNYIFILNTEDALNLFLSNDGVKWDASAQATAGPNTVSDGKTPTKRPGIYVYTEADGVYGGATVGGTTLRSDNKVNQAAYGQNYSLLELLKGKAARPKEAAELYEWLNGTVQHK